MIELEKIKELCKDKNVLLVGNNDTINKRDNSQIIDSFDVVVRMNHAIPEKNLGNKTDIWLCSFNNVQKQERILPLFNPKVTIRLNKNEYINDKLKSKLYVWSEEKHLSFKEKLGSLPSTGCMAIEFFLNDVGVEHLYLIGYDFFETKSFYNATKIAHQYHKPENEKKYIQKLIEENKVELLSC